MANGAIGRRVQVAPVVLALVGLLAGPGCQTAGPRGVHYVPSARDYAELPAAEADEARAAVDRAVRAGALFYEPHAMAAAEYYLRIMEAQAAEGDAAGARDYAGLALRHAQEAYEGARPDAAIEREAPATKAGALAFFEEQRERYRAVEREGAAEVAPRLFARAGADLSRGEHELRQTGHGKEGVGALLRAAAVLDQVEALDADEDGVLDLADAAPDEPEDVDGYEDGDGAPDPDNDRDGIPDTIDRAPLEPETVNGWMDMDGAPDSLPQLAPVTFARGSASVGREARGYLRGLSALLAASDALGLSIAARADPGLAPAEALALARRRGQAVRDALVEAGMDPARLETTFSAEGPADGFGQVQLAIE